MSIANLKKLAAAFNVPHAESTTAGHECLHCVCEAARAEIAAMEKAAKILTDSEVKRAVRHAPDDVKDTIEWLESIAQEAP